MRATHLFTITTLIAAAVSLSSVARAEEPEELLELGYGHPGNNRLSVSGGMLEGERPWTPDGDVAVDPNVNPNPVPPTPVATPLVEPKEKYNRAVGWVTYEYYSFWDKTRFDTLVGTEFLVGAGYLTPEKADPERVIERSANWSKPHLKAEFAFDYAPIHWGGGLPGRLVFGLGAGAELGSYWQNEDGRTYPLVAGRAQLFPNQSFGIHLAYHWMPTCTGNYKVREHRYEATVALGSWQLGVHGTETRVLDASDTALMSRHLGGLIGYTF